MIGIVQNPLGWPSWPKARALLVESVDQGDFTTIEDVEKELAGDARLWVAGDVEFAAVVQILNTKTGKQLFIWQAAGDFAKWRDKLTGLCELWALAEGCQTMEMNGRMGWSKLLNGWECVAVTMRKVL